MIQQQNQFYEELKEIIIESKLSSSSAIEEIAHYKESISSIKNFESEILVMQADKLTAEQIQELDDYIEFNKQLLEARGKVGPFTMLDNRGKRAVRSY